MDIKIVFFVSAFSIGPILLFVLVKILRNMVRKQIDDQLKEIIPIRSIRNRIGIKINWIK